MAKPIQHASRYLQSHAVASALLPAIERDAALLRRVGRALSAPLDSHCLHATIDDHVLVVTTDSSAWASRLRFAAPELLRTLSGTYDAVVSCRVRIQPQSGDSTTGNREEPRRQLSEDTVRHLLEAAAALEDTDLSEALRRLARAGNRRG
ncbi:MAG: DciA family protein [Chromatiaceae bacterium]